MLGERKVLGVDFSSVAKLEKGFFVGSRSRRRLFKFLLSTALKNSFEANVEKISSRES